MGQISSGSLTIVDVTDGAPGLNNTTVFLYQRAVNAPDKPTGNLTYTFATATVTGSLDGWVQNINSLTGSNPIWMIAAVASSNGSTDVIEPSEWAGPIKMAQNGQDGQPGTNGTNGLNQATVFIYKRGDSAATPSSVTYTFSTGNFTTPSGWNKTIPTTPKGKPCWVTSAIAIGAEATAELNWATPSVLVEDGTDGISPTVTATENGVKIVDADGNETTITNGADGTSYYTFVRYSKNANGSGYVVTPTSETIYIGVYTGTESSPPVYSDVGWKWSRYVGADGQPGTQGPTGPTGPQGVSVTATRELYYLKTNSTDPAQITNANQIHNTDDVNQWTSVVPTYIGSGKYYTCIETNLSNGNTVWSAPIENKGLTDANVNAANAIEIARGVKQHFFWVATDKSENVPAGAYVAEQSEESFYSSPTKGNILTRSDGIWIRNGADKLATLQGSGLTFLVPTGTYKGQKSVSLNGSGLTFYNIGSSNSAAATLASDGLQITNGSIVLGTTSGTAAGNVTLSNQNFTRSINETSHDNLRFAIGSKFGVASDGTLYSSGLDSVASRVDDIEDWEIGGRNLLRNSGTYDGWSKNDGVTSDGNILDINVSGATSNLFRKAVGPLVKTFNELNGKTCVVSFEVYCDDWSAVEAGTGILGANAVQMSLVTFNATDDMPVTGYTLRRYRYGHLTDGTLWNQPTSYANGEWIKITSKPFSVPEVFSSTDVTTEYGTYVGVTPQLRRNGHVKFRNIKWEIGNKATDWTPAPEDIDDRVDTLETFKSEFTVTPLAISSEVTATQNGETLVSRINQTADTVKIEANHVEIDGTAIFSNTDFQTELADSQNAYTVIWDKNYGTSSAGGEAIIQKKDPLTGVITNAAGWVIWNGTKRTVPAVEYNPNSMIPFNIPVYLVLRLSSASSTTGTVYPVWYANSKWNYLNKGVDASTTDNAVADWTWVEATDIVLGSCVEPANEAVLTDCVIYDPPWTCKQVTSDTVTARSANAAAAAAQTTANNAAPKANAVKRTQRIYYQNNSTTAPATPGTASSNWVTDNTGGSGKWTKKRMSYSSSNKYIWTCEQSENAAGTVSYTSVLLDDSTTVIDGGNIITGTVTANQLAANAVTADKIAANAVTVGKINPVAYAYSNRGQGDGYAKLFTISHTVEYRNAPISFLFHNRGKKETRVALNFTNTSTPTSATVQNATYDGDTPFYYVSKGSAVYDVYFQLAESWDNTYVTNYINQYSTGLEVVWGGSYYGTELPTGAVAFTKLAGSRTSAELDNAAKTATSYITNIDSNNGITIKAVNGATSGSDTTKQNYIKLNADGLDVYKGGTSVAKYGDTARIGKDGSSRFLMNADSLQAYNSSNKKYFEVSASGMKFGTDLGSTVATTSNVASEVNATRSWYATCSTAADTAAKVATISPTTTAFTTSILKAGTLVNVKFTVTNTAAVADLTLNVNSTGAKHIKTLRYGAINNIAGTGYLAANTTYQFTYDGTYWVMQENYNSDTYDRKRISNAVIVAENITQYCIAGRSGTGHKKLVANLEIDLTFPICYLNQANASGQSYAVASGSTTINFYTAYPSVNLQNTKGSWTGTNRAVCYIKGTLTGQKFKVHSDVFTTSIPSNNDGFAYIPIGVMYSTYQVNFACDNTVYAFRNGSFHKIDTVSDYVTQIDSNGIWITPTNKKPTNTSTGANATGAKIDANGMQIYKDGVSLANYGDTARIGKSNSQHIEIDSTNGLRIMNGSTVLATYKDRITMDDLYMFDSGLRHEITDSDGKLWYSGFQKFLGDSTGPGYNSRGSTAFWAGAHRKELIQNDTEFSVSHGGLIKATMLLLGPSGGPYIDMIRPTAVTITATKTSGSSTLSSFTAKRIGGILYVRFIITASAAISAGSNAFVGTISTTALRPTIESKCIGYYDKATLMANIATNGTITVRVLGAALANGNAIALTGSWPVNYTWDMEY